MMALITAKSVGESWSRQIVPLCSLRCVCTTIEDAFEVGSEQYWKISCAPVALSALRTLFGLVTLIS